MPAGIRLGLNSTEHKTYSLDLSELLESERGRSIAAMNIIVGGGAESAVSVILGLMLCLSIFAIQHNSIRVRNRNGDI